MDNTISVPHTYLTQCEVKRLYTILENFNNAAYKSSLQYTIACGTALGAVLRGGLIPWDKDADLFARETEFDSALPILVRNAAPNLIIKKYTRWSDGRGWYKIYDSQSVTPNVDIFLLSYVPSENIWRPVNDHIRQRSPKLFLDCEQMGSYQHIYFGPLQLPIFAVHDRFLDRYYGPQWRYISTEKEAEDSQPSLPAILRDYRPSVP
jgi:phosphorylcholine metabolism protein LicD